MRKPVSRGLPRTARCAALLLVLGVGPLAGCGIQETAVVEAGRPAVADLLPPREGRVLLFFFSPDGELLPVPRNVDAAWRGGVPASSMPDDPSAPADGTPGGNGLGGPPPGDGGMSGPLSTLAAVTALLAGPDTSERRAGLRSAPSLPGASVADRIDEGDLTVEVVLRARVARLSAPARDQLVCTAAYAAHTKGAVSVTLVGQEGRLPPAECPVRPVPVPAR
ncbi:hypothetical protein [Streptomyces griseus]|uniref:hypothetical protein n=1 Tax=Streptomyces griseus TaxID=1911 RepID=UPI00084056F0|nr:hypothetical protein [Streptomyces griseus]